jgi:hypothetical protein
MMAGDGSRCHWHQEWARVMEPRGLIDEYAAFDAWLQQFRPGGPYGHSPGQWWATTDALFAAIHGLGPNPIMNDSIRMELDLRHCEAYRNQRGLPMMGYSGKRIDGAPLPEFNLTDMHQSPAPALETLQQRVRSYANV